MEPNRSQNMDGFRRSPAPGAAARPHRPNGLVHDFGARPVAPPPQPSPTQSAKPSPAQFSVPKPHSSFRDTRPTQTVSGYVTTPLSTQQNAKVSHSSSTASPANRPDLEHIDTKLEAPQKQKEIKPKSETGHAGLIGLALFALLTALFLLPFLPGKTLDNFPGSSQSFSSGDQSFACLEQPTSVKSATEFNNKAGFPITYKYTSITTQQASCDGDSQTIVAGRSSQFNLLGLVADVLLAFALALGISALYKIIYRAGHKPQQV